jgi:hypothetical protein
LTLGPVSDGRFASIVSKNSFPLLTENSQSRWCVSLAPMGGTTLITAKTDAGNSDVLQSVAAALIRLHSTFGRFSAPLDFRIGRNADIASPSRSSRHHDRQQQRQHHDDRERTAATSSSKPRRASTGDQSSRCHRLTIILSTSAPDEIAVILRDFILPTSASRVLKNPQGASLVRLEPSPVSDTSRRPRNAGRRGLRGDGGDLRCRSVAIPDRGEDHPLHSLSGVSWSRRDRRWCASDLSRVIVHPRPLDAPVNAPVENPCAVYVWGVCRAENTCRNDIPKSGGSY